MELLDRRERATFAFVSLFAAFVLSGLGYLFLSHGLSSGNELVSVISYVAAAFFDLGALFYLGSGVYHGVKVLNG